MPYRRLPNTDKARIQAIEKALFTQKNSSNKAISASDEYKLEIKINDFNTVLNNYKEAIKQQKEYNKIHNELLQKTRMYLTHFIKIINFAIARDEYPKQIRKFYKLPLNSNILPSLQTFEQIDNWCKKIITGEQNRVATGAKPFQSPSIASINTIYERLKDANYFLDNFKRKTSYAKKKLSNIRPEIDKLIKNTWNQIEHYFENYPALVRREKAKSFGIVYFYRKNEEKIELKDLLA